MSYSRSQSEKTGRGPARTGRLLFQTFQFDPLGLGKTLWNSKLLLTKVGHFSHWTQSCVHIGPWRWESEANGKQEPVRQRGTICQNHMCHFFLFFFYRSLSNRWSVQRSSELPIQRSHWHFWQHKCSSISWDGLTEKPGPVFSPAGWRRWCVCELRGARLVKNLPRLELCSFSI